MEYKKTGLVTGSGPWTVKWVDNKHINPLNNTCRVRHMSNNQTYNSNQANQNNRVSNVKNQANKHEIRRLLSVELLE